MLIAILANLGQPKGAKPCILSEATKVAESKEWQVAAKFESRHGWMPGFF